MGVYGKNDSKFLRNNETILEYYIKNNIEIKNFISFNLDLDKDIANVDPAYL